MKTSTRVIALLSTALALAAGSFAASSAGANTVPVNGSELRFVGRWTSGAGLGGAEISAVDKESKRLFVTNGAKNTIDIVDISNPKKVKLVKSVDFTALGSSGIQSVAAKNGIVVVASAGASKTAPGILFVMDVDGTMVKGLPAGLTVGALPDSVTISKDGKYAISSNEGEPKDYCLVNGALPETTDPKGSISIVDLAATPPTVKTVDFTSFAQRKNVIIESGGRVFGPGASLEQDLEPEYAAISADSTTAYVTLQENNSVATVDLATATITNVLGLGYKNHNVYNTGLDFDDRDNAINIVARNVKGMYLPDAIASLTAGGNTYMITANEGDGREYPCLMGGTSTTKAEAEDERYGDVGLDANLKSVAKRAKVTLFPPAVATGTAVTSKTTVTPAYMFGTRSFTVWKTNTTSGVFKAELVYDSGDEIERVVAMRRPALFNADWNTNSGLVSPFESRSSSKGPEPEGVAVGKAYGRQWMVLALERDSGIMLYDITNPVLPQFRQYLNTSLPGENILSANGAGDVSPEGVLFLEANESPTGKPMVVVSYELSGTVAMFELTAPAPTKAGK
jgi:DNA-binding beta-propeller fold protein YncE